MIKDLSNPRFGGYSAATIGGYNLRRPTGRGILHLIIAPVDLALTPERS